MTVRPPSKRRPNTRSFATCSRMELEDLAKQARKVRDAWQERSGVRYSLGEALDELCEGLLKIKR